MREYKLNGPRPGGFVKPQASKEPLTDLSPMPFGKYGPKPKGEGRLMQDVPATYLIWLWDNGAHAKKGDPVHEYIKESWNAILKDCPDYIPENPPARDY